MQKHPLITGKSFNMQQVLLMSEEEKHLYVIYYNFSKYKVNRLDLKLKYDEDLQFKEIKNKLIDIKEQKIEITAKFIKKANREDITYYYGFIKVDHATADRKKLQQMIEHNDKIQKQMEYNAEIQKLLDHNDKVQKVVDYKLSIELFSKQCEHYINNIFINISNKDKIENRYNLFMTL
jgi:transaldolase